MLRAGMTQTHIARQIGVYPSVIHRLSLGFTQTNNKADRPRSGQSQCNTTADYCFLRTCALRSRIISGAQNILTPVQKMMSIAMGKLN